MKKILLINSSNRKRNTYKLLLDVEKMLKLKGFNTEVLNLHDYKINFCKGCEVCILKGGCTIRDDVEIIKNKIIGSDGIVIGTPVYLNNMSGILKTFIDRTCSWFHRTEVSKKPVLLIANTQGSGIKSTLNSIEEVMIQWGASLAGNIARSGRNFNEPIKEKEVKKFIDLLNSNSKNYSPTLKEVYTYNIQRTLAMNIFKVDKEYWEKNKWIDKAYFPGVKISIVKKIYGNRIHGILRKVIKPINKEK